MFLISQWVILCVYLAACEQYEPTNDLELHLGTKSPYSVIANTDDAQVQFEGCTPRKIWMLVRHGTRNPSKQHITAMQTRLAELRDLVAGTENELIQSDLKLLMNWKNDLDAKNEKKLTSEGANEMVLLAERMQARFPEILQGIYSNTSYQFRYTRTSRTKNSAKNFAVGLFGKKTAKDVWFPEPVDNDPLLRFYKVCSKWQKEVKRNPESLVELRKFKDTDVAQQAVHKIQSKLGLANGTLQFDDVAYMYTTCAFETAWNRKKKSPWCAVFDLETIKIFEYADDLKHFWIDGYGYDLTFKQACPAFNDMFGFHEADETFPRAVVYFTHSGTLLKMISHIGLYNDRKPLNHDEIDDEREWRVSKIDTFATNLAFVSFECTDGVKLLLLHQEKIVRFPCCPDSDLCELSTIRKHYSQSVDKCNFEQICNADEE